MLPEIEKGYYRHYKGRYYEVLDLVRHSESEEWLVLYRCCYGDRSRWVRPYDLFVSTVSLSMGEVRRFAWVGATLPAGCEDA